MFVSTEKVRQQLAVAWEPGRRRETAALVLLFVFLPFVETIRNAGSVSFILLVLLSLPGVVAGWRAMERDDKRVFWAFLVLILISVISLVHTVDWAEAGRRFDRLLRLALVIPVFIYLRRIHHHVAAPFRWGIIAAGVVMGAVALYQFGHGGWYWWRPARGAYQHILLGEYAALTFAVGLTFLVLEKPKARMRLLWVASIVGSFVALLLTGARSAWIALPAVLVILAWVYWKGETDAHRRTRVLVVAGFVLVIGLSALSQVKLVKKRMRAVDTNIVSYFKDTKRNTSIGTRFMLWKNAFVMWERHPILGTGLGDYRHDNREMVRHSQTDLEWALGEAHNIYMEFLATTGLLGAVALILAIVIVPSRYFYKRILRARSPPDRAIATSGLMVPVCYGIFGLGQTWTAHQPAITAYALILVTLMVLSASPSIRESDGT